MQFKHLFFSVFMGAVWSFSSFTADLTQYLPSRTQDMKWTLDSESIQIVKGDNLFTLINGGAEMYHEYGFESVLAAEYVDDKENSISVEIYNMKSDSAAYGMYSFKRGQSGDILSIGNECTVEDYYLNAWKNTCLITVTGYSQNVSVKSGIQTIVSDIAKRIPEGGQIPSIFDLFNGSKDKMTHNVYFKGPLALMNLLNIQFKEVFGFSEGAKVVINNKAVFIFTFNNSEQYKQTLIKLKKIFSLKSEDSLQLCLTDSGNRELVFKKGENILTLELNE